MLFLCRYNIPWYLAPLNIQKLILFLLQRGSKVFTLSFGGLITGSLENFASVKLFCSTIRVNNFEILCSHNTENTFVYSWQVHQYLISLSCTLYIDSKIISAMKKLQMIIQHMSFHLILCAGWEVFLRNICTYLRRNRYLI